MKSTIVERWERLLVALRPNSGYLLLAISLLFFAGHQGTGLGAAFLGLAALLLAAPLLPQASGEAKGPALLGLVVLASVAANFVSHPIIGMGIVGALPLFTLGLAFWMGARLPEGAEKKVLGILGGLALACAAYGLPARVKGVLPYEGWFFDYNSAGTLFNLGVFSFVALWQATRRKLFLAPAVLLVAAIVFSASRGALLTLGLGTLLCLIHARKELWSLPSKVKLQLAGGVATVGVILSYIAIHNGMLDRLSRLGADESTSGRWAMWVASWKMYLDSNWLTGAGLGLWGQLYPNYRQRQDFESAGSMAHNDYVHILAEAGPALALAVVVLAAVVLWRAISRRSSPVQATAAAGAALALAHATFNFPLHSVQLTTVIGLLAGIALSRSPRGASQPLLVWSRRLFVGVTAALLPAIAWLFVEVTTANAAFGVGTWPARILPEFGKLPVLQKLFGEYGERALSGMPARTLATHYMLQAMAKQDSVETNRELLTKAIEVYNRAPAPMPDAYAPAQIHLLMQGILIKAYEKEPTLAKVRALLEPMVKRFPTRTDNRLLWADYLKQAEGYAAAKAYLEAERAKSTSLSFEGKMRYWLKSNDPNRQILSREDLMSAL